MLILLIGAVALCGGVFLAITKNLLLQSRQAQTAQFAYGVAASIGGTGTQDPKNLRAVLQRLELTPGLDFAIITGPDLDSRATFTSDPLALQTFLTNLRSTAFNAIGRAGQVIQLPVGRDHTTLVVTVPIFAENDNQKSVLQGYLHVGFTSDLDARLRFLQGLILLTCMGVVLVALPIATLVARHVTVPIETLATAARALAGGNLGHRVSLFRHDELGDLADAFNSMAHTVQTQQEAIKSINADLEHKVHVRTAELEKVNTRLQAEMAEKEDFLRAVSHDLNAPLRNISGMASMLLIKYKDTLEKDALQRLERIQKNVDVECELISELLELSRIKTRREKIETIDLHELLEQVADQFSSDFETHKISFHVTGRLPVMKCERSRFRQVFQNLIDNAVKYMRADGSREINVALRWEPEDLVISFTDTGIGIAKEEIPHLFHVFRRAKNATIMKIPGKGVGLASVKSIIENYAGKLWVESAQGTGTTFFISLPKHCFTPDKPQEVAA